MPDYGARALQRDDLRQSLIVSCQPVPGGPTDGTDFVVGFASAAVAAGARALRIESTHYVAAVRAAVGVPIIGIVKRDLDDSPVRITPFASDVEALAAAGADIIAFDATDRVRPEPMAALLQAVRRHGRLAMADCSCLEDARRALDAGVDFVGTTMSGYTGGPVPEAPDIALVAAMRRLTPYVIAEGRLKAPSDAADAARAGAFAVVVGSAITRTEHVTQWFLEAVTDAYARSAAAGRARLAIDIGGTKTMAAMVREGAVAEEVVIPTARDGAPEHWLEAIHREVATWDTGNAAIGIAVTGVVRHGRWSALNPGTLAIPDHFPLVEAASSLFGGRAVVAVNDAQAAAWGEYRHGAGRGCRDMAFLTVSTGIGGGLVLGGRLLGGLAGHFGQTGVGLAGERLEDLSSGRWMEREALRHGHTADARAVFGAAETGAPWAKAIVEEAARRIGGLCRDIKLTLDVERIVIGGGVGLATGFIQLVRQFTTGPGAFMADIVAAELGRHAGVIGAADLAAQAGP